MTKTFHGYSIPHETLGRIEVRGFEGCVIKLVQTDQRRCAAFDPARFLAH